MSNSKYNSTVTVFGATGLVGKALIDLLVQNDQIKLIHIANRRSVGYSSKKIKEHLIDFDQLSTYQELFQVDHLYICLGTTIKTAGSKEAFQKVDLELPRKIAELAKENKVKQLIMISALGANATSSNFYLKTKGKAENEVMKNGPTKVYFVRPSLLMGEREESRLGEKVGQLLMKTFGFLMLGPLKKYSGIYDVEVAAAMIYILQQEPDQTIFQSDELLELAKKYHNQP